MEDAPTPAYQQPSSQGPAKPGPTTALPPRPRAGTAAHPAPPPGYPRYPAPVREPSDLERSISRFWTGRNEPLPGWLLALALVVGVVGAGVLVGHRAGLGAALVGGLVWAGAVPLLVRRRSVSDLVLVLLAIALVGVVAVRDAGWVVAVCVLVALWVGAVALTSARSAGAVLLAPVGWAGGLVRTVPWVARGAGALTGSRRAQTVVAARSVAITVVLLVVFGMLFASADPVFASYLPRWQGDDVPAQMVLGLLVAVVTATAAHLVLAPPAGRSLQLAPAPAASRGEWLLPVLGLDALVVAFVGVQVAALMGGHRYVQQTAGLGYAEYARTGFAQLVAATVLTLVVVAVAARRAPRATAKDRLVTRIALAVLCVATLGVVASALRRMDLYVEAYGLTRLRLFVVGFEVVLGVALLLVLVAGVRWRGTWLPRATVQLVAVAALVLAAVNPDAMIVRHNTTADLAVGLDDGYLQGLSADAVPAMAELPEPLRSCLLAGALPADTAGREPEGVAGWNLGRARAAQALADGEPIAASTGAACTSLGAGSR